MHISQSVGCIVQKLAHAYDLLHRAYSKVVEVMQSGRRLLGQYFRVAFFGAVSSTSSYIFYGFN